MMTTLTPQSLEAALSGDAEELGIHLELVDRDIEIEGRGVRVHCHCLKLDGNGRIGIPRLIEYMRDSLVDYAIPRSKMAQARAHDQEHNTSRAVMGLFHEAKATFSDLVNTGEGGELLLFLLAERFLELPQILCKMHLKTNPRMHYHGSDAVHAGVTEDGLLKLYWGESKMYGNATDAVRECLSSLAPFLSEEDHEDAAQARDLVLLSDRADLNDPQVNSALQRYFERSSPLSKRVRYCGVALIAFDVRFYPTAEASVIAETMIKQAREELAKVVNNVADRLDAEKLADFEIQILCLPLPSVEDFRRRFREALGKA
ncbi:HamA C-terminal domain-containing protein [Erythrobacter sp.]|uniref:HamA C-terminal domain-containing protein n=1 Tax=Erythrobacter sp. TaxID=1042 RepID=UPI003C7847E5